MGYTLVIAEKPSVGRDIARVLGVRERNEGYLQSDAYRVTWAIGHLVALVDPEEIDPKYKKWREADLPILPETIPLKVLPKTKKQYGIIRKLVADKACEGIVCATDAGREGELIFRYIYKMIGVAKPVKRLWISSMTDEAIREGLASMKPGSAYEPLYQSARCRSEADWLVGMNASRAFTLRYGALLSIGRVQTPTLAILVRRHHEIAAFVTRPYWTVTAQYKDFSGLWLNEETGEKRLYDEAKATEIAQKVHGKEAVVEAVTREAKKEWPPFLYDLTSLQRDANRQLGFTAQKTLTTAQKLYEEEKLLTYPRTDSRHLPKDMAQRTFKAMQTLPEAYAQHAAPLLAAGKLPLVRRVFDDAKVTDHHAIIPTGKKANLEKLTLDARALYDMVVRRLLAAFYPAFEYDAVRVLSRCEEEAFESLGREIKQQGWKQVYADAPTEKAKSKRAKQGEVEEQRLPNLAQGETRTVQKTLVKVEKTKPPAPHTEASLLSSMERVGKELEDEALRESMKDHGLGTPATRAAIIERLISVGYAARKGKAIQATEKGINLIAVVPEDIASPQTTGVWEKALADIAQSQMDTARFLDGIRGLAASLVQSAKTAPSDVVFPQEERKGRGRKTAAPKALEVPCPLCAEGKVLENSKAFYCSRWKEGCKLTLWKDAAVRAGGPLLTPALVTRLLKEGQLRGSTGILTYKNGVIGFIPGGQS